MVLSETALEFCWLSKYILTLYPDIVLEEFEEIWLDMAFCIAEDWWTVTSALPPFDLEGSILKMDLPERVESIAAAFLTTILSFSWVFWAQEE